MKKNRITNDYIYVVMNQTKSVDSYRFYFVCRKMLCVVYIEVGSCWNGRRVNDCCDMSMQNMQTNQFDYRSNEIMWKSCFSYKSACVSRTIDELPSTLSLPVAHNTHLLDCHFRVCVCACMYDAILSAHTARWQNRISDLSTTKT